MSSETPADTILLVEDETIVALTERKTLESKGYRVLLASTGEAAVETILSGAEIDLVLMDIDLGEGIDGAEAARRILEHRHLPIVFLTSHTEPEYVELVRQVSRYGYVIKNSGEFVLQDTIEVALELFEANRRYEREAAALRESEERYRLLVENTRVAMAIHELILDDEGRPIDYVFLQANPAFERQTGLCVREILGRRVTEVLPGIELTPFIRIYGEVVLENKPVSFEQYSEPLQRHYSVDAYRTAPGRFATVFTDITEQKRMQAVLEQSENRFRSMFHEHSAVKLMIEPESGAIIDANDAAARFYGWSRDELKRKTIHEINTLSPDEVAAEMEKADRAEQSFFEFRHHRADGSVRDVEVYSTRIQASDWAVLYSIIHDVTDRKQAEQRVRTLLEEQKLIMREVHHRIKNNMNIMSGLLSLQAQMPENAAAREVLEDAQNRMQSMAVLYDKLYTSSDVRAVSAAEYLPPLVDEVLQTFPNADAVAVTTKIEDFVLTAEDLAPLGIIVNELITNAMKHAFAENGGTLEVTAGLAGDQATIVVADNGAGGRCSGGQAQSAAAGVRAGFGLNLVQMLAEQLEGSVAREYRNGMRWVLQFPVRTE